MNDRIPAKEVQDKKTQDKDGSTIHYRQLYEAADKIYTRKISGFFQRIRRYTGLPLVIGFLLMPWLVIDGRPAMLFDLPARQFHILWMTFWPQDGMYLAWLLIISAFGLFTVTVLVGRVWCGFTCPQTVWTLMFIWAEHFCEGDRNKRIKLDGQDWNAEKILRKSGKHFLWVAIAFITGITFVGYFTPVRELLAGFIPHIAGDGYVSFEISAVAAFWTLFFTVMTYMNAGWLREQVCKYMCPYARFQSVMYDRDTLAVHYDAARGEARGPRKTSDDYKAEGKGDCIDCSWCVQVCPVDIDIRNGLQYECINCGLCVDACNQVMDKMHYPRGLIRFTSEDELETGHTNFVRPRLFGYSLAMLVMMSAFVYNVSHRQPLSIDVARDRGTKMYRLSGDNVQNVYTININNMDRHAHTYQVAVSGKHDYEVRAYRPMQLAEGERLTLPLRVVVPVAQLPEAKNEITITVTAIDSPEITAQQKTVFIGPHK